jgi:hypothetical protein
MKKFYDYGRAIAALEVLEAYGQAGSAVVLKSAAIIREYLDANPVDHAGVDSGQLTVDNEKPKLGVFNEEVEAALAALTKVLRNRPDPIATFVGPALSDKKPVEIPKSNPSEEKNPEAVRPYSARHKKQERARLETEGTGPSKRKNKLAAVRTTDGDKLPATRPTFNKAELKEQFALGECATVVEALEMAVELMGRDGVCALIGCDPRPLGLALKGVQTSKRIAEFIEPLLPNLG